MRHEHRSFWEWRGLASLGIPILVTYVLLVPTASWIRVGGTQDYVPALVAALGCFAGAVLSWAIVCQVVGADAKMWAMVLGFLPRTIVPLVVVGAYSVFVERLVSITAFVYCILFYAVALVSESWLTINSLRREGLGGDLPEHTRGATEQLELKSGPARSRKE
ncbi:MAG: hypothetical protein ACUVTW_10035 [Thermogutta sp.]